MVCLLESHRAKQGFPLDLLLDLHSTFLSSVREVGGVRESFQIRCLEWGEGFGGSLGGDPGNHRSSRVSVRE